MGRRLSLLLGGLVAAALLVWWLAAEEPPARAHRASDGPRIGDRSGHRPVPAGHEVQQAGDRIADNRATGRLVLRGGWGGGPGQFGRVEAPESNPEAPMALTLDPAGNLLVLDQANRRIQRFDPRGQLLGSLPLATVTAQDLVADGEGIAVLDRLGQPGVYRMGPDGSPRGRLPVVGGKIHEGGAITGLFSDADGLYVEQGHDDLVRVADAQGQAAGLQETIPGRPSRDGKLFLKAGVIEKQVGRVYVQAHDTSLKLAWETPLGLGRPLLHLLLLDSDSAGNVYLAGEVGQEDPATHDYVDLATLVVRLDDGGRLSGVLELPPSTTDAAETFRPLAVAADGTVYHMVPSQAGLTVTAYRFPAQ